MTTKRKDSLARAYAVHAAWNEVMLGGYSRYLLWSLRFIAYVALVVVGIGLLWLAFIEHDALYEPFSLGALRVLIFAGIGFYALHETFYALHETFHALRLWVERE